MKVGWIYKVILVGSRGTGKSSFIKNDKSIPNERYLEDYSKTIGTNFYIKKIPVTSKKFCQLQFWDLNVAEHFYFVLPSFFRGTSAFLLFFDTSDYSSFADLELWIDIINSYSEEIPIFLIGTKTDLCAEVPVDEILGLIQTHGLHGPFFTSTKRETHNIIYNYIIENLTGIELSPRNSEIISRMQEQFVLNSGASITSSNHRTCREDSQSSLVLLREIMQGDFTYPTLMKKDLSYEEEKNLKLFLEYFQYCPICHQENHQKYLTRFYLSQDPFKIRLKESVLSLIEESEWNDRVYFNRLTVGIPCCNCFHKIFKNN